MTTAAVQLSVLERRLETASPWVAERLAFPLAQLRERVAREKTAAAHLTIVPPARRTRFPKGRAG